MTEAEIASLRPNQRHVARELLRRGVDVTLFDRTNEVLEASLGGHSELLLDIDSSVMPYTASVIASSKSLTKKLLARAGVSVSTGERFSSSDHAGATAYASGLGYPVVVKPSLGVHGEGVQMFLESESDVKRALDVIGSVRGEVEVIVEEQFTGEEFRVFVTRRGDFAVVRRDPAHVTGDGVSTLAALTDAENDRRGADGFLRLRRMRIDAESRRYLARSGRTPATVPAPGEKVYLRSCSNVNLGGVPVDVTSDVHPSVVGIAMASLEAVPGLPYCGVDLLSVDVSAPQTPVTYRVIELNSLPELGIHLYPAAGRARNVAAMVADVMFPETAEHGPRPAAAEWMQ